MKNLIFILIFLPFFTRAQVSGNTNVGVSLPLISILDIEPNNSPIVLQLPAPTEAGTFINFIETNNAKWLNYTSALQAGRQRRVIVQINNGSVPAGLILKMWAQNAVNGLGAIGTPAGTLTLSGSPQVLINNIGAAFTGSGTNRGHALSYRLEVTDVSKLDFNASGTLGITFTIQDN